MIQGIPVGLIFPDDEERQVVFAKVRQAFELVARYDSRSLSRRSAITLPSARGRHTVTAPSSV